MNLLQGRLRSLVAAEMDMIQFLLIVLGLSLRPMYAFCKLFSTRGIVILRQFLDLPQKPFANLKYFFLLKPAINIQLKYILVMSSEISQFDEKNLIQAIQKFSWEDVLDTPLGDTPKNQWYQFQPLPEYTKYYRLFRAMLNKEESSARSFALTTLMLKLKLNNYYALMLRKSYYLSLPQNENRFIHEIAFVNLLLTYNSKEYQLWTYKKQLFGLINLQLFNKDTIYQIQLQHLDTLLEADSKNYHVWDYKLWLTLHFKNQKKQIQESKHKIFNHKSLQEEIEKKLKQSNLTVHSINWSNCYSLWSYRYNLIKNYLKSITLDQRHQFEIQEIRLVKQWLQKAQNNENECGWNYLTGLILSWDSFDEAKKYQIYEFARAIFDNDAFNRFAGNTCLQILQFLAEHNKEKYQEQLSEILELLKVVDPVRQLYYDYKLQI